MTKVFWFWRHHDPMDDDPGKASLHLHLPCPLLILSQQILPGLAYRAE